MVRRGGSQTEGIPEAAPLTPGHVADRVHSEDQGSPHTDIRPCAMTHNWFYVARVPLGPINPVGPSSGGDLPHGEANSDREGTRNVISTWMRKVVNREVMLVPRPEGQPKTDRDMDHHPGMDLVKRGADPVLQ